MIFSELSKVMKIIVKYRITIANGSQQIISSFWTVFVVDSDPGNWNRPIGNRSIAQQNESDNTYKSQPWLVQF